MRLAPFLPREHKRVSQAAAWIPVHHRVAPASEAIVVYDRGEQVGEYRAIIEAEISEDKYKVFFLDSNSHAWPLAKTQIKTIDDGAPCTSPIEWPSAVPRGAHQEQRDQKKGQ